jgi:tetratricopeptide (TPR) repeat protein
MNRWPALLLAGGVLVAAWMPLACAAEAVSDPDALLDTGDAAWEQGRIEEAEGAYRQAIEADPEAATPRLRLAGLQLAQQRYHEGLRSYQSVLALQPDDATLGHVYVGMGLAYLHLGNRELARQAFTQAVDHVSEERRRDLESVLEHLASPDSAPVPGFAHP